MPDYAAPFIEVLHLAGFERPVEVRAKLVARSSAMDAGQPAASAPVQPNRL